MPIPNNELNLPDFFKRRKESEGTFKQEAKILWEKLINLVPKELERFQEAALSNEEWLDDLFTNTAQNSCNHDKIKNLNDYGFTSMTDAKKKLQLLKAAWKGIIKVTILKEDWYVRVEFRLGNTAKIVVIFLEGAYCSLFFITKK